MKTSLSMLLLLVCAFGIFAQKTKRPRPIEQPTAMREEYSSVYDIRNFEKFYVQMDFKLPDRNAAPITKVLSAEQSIKAVKDWGDAQFVVTYKETANKSQMQVYYVREKTRVIVWTEYRAGKDKQIELAEEFLKVLRRNKKLDAPLPVDGEG